MNGFRTILKNPFGFTITELMVGLVIGLITLAASIHVFTNQQSLLKDENDSTKVRAKGRQAIKILAREIRMAGFGLPPGGALTDIGTPGSISFRTNKNFAGREARTWTTLEIAENSPSISVDNGIDFKDGDKIVVYQTGFYRSKECLVDSDGSTNSISIGCGGGSNFGSPAFEFGFNASLITVNKFNEWTIVLVGDEIQKTIDGANTVVLIDDLVPAPKGLEFDYFGITDTTTSRIGITLNLLDPGNDDAAIEFKTDVTLRNLGIKG